MAGGYEAPNHLFIMFRKQRMALWLVLLVCLSTFTPRPLRAAAPPDEGMWLPLLISQNIAAMQKIGLKLSAEDIYSVNKGSLKDAVVHFGGFCTGEIISDQGLILTNHHCGYDAIQSQSTVENNILANGFWAADKTQEKPIPGLFVRFLVRIENVTADVKKKIAEKAAAVTTPLSETDQVKAIGAVTSAIAKAADENGKYYTTVAEMFYGNEYYLYVYQVFNDVRLVGTPPESLGKFGGDTDNWMWPRHTADFSMFRVYANKNNEASAYSAENMPYKPKHYLPISLKGVAEDDFSMIMGFPGRTKRYQTSDATRLDLDVSNPARIKLRDNRLHIWKSYMDQSPAVRLQYSSKYARIANYWKYFIGQNKGLRRLGTVDVKRKQESDFTTWVNQDPARKAKYGSVLSTLQQLYKESEETLLPSVYLQEALTAPEIIAHAATFYSLKDSLKKYPKATPEQLKAVLAKLNDAEPKFWKDYHAAADQQVFETLLGFYHKDIPKAYQPTFFAEIETKYKGNFHAFAEDIFERSFFASQAKTKAFLAKPSLKALEADPVWRIANSIFEFTTKTLSPKRSELDNKIRLQYRTFMEGWLEFQAGKKVAYPDANSTQRLTYGQVRRYDPMDAVKYNYQTTLRGLVEKFVPGDEEFDAPKRLIELEAAADYGDYGFTGTDGKKHMPVCFIANTDITGGNSGSPVMNGNGELIGLAFDGNWEAMSGDIVFDAEYKRTINVDIRYVLFLIDKLAGAKHIIAEMKLVR
jgi:hypothetical protein